MVKLTLFNLQNMCSKKELEAFKRDAEAHEIKKIDSGIITAVKDQAVMNVIYSIT